MLRKKVINIYIDLLSYAEALACVLVMGKNHESGYVCFANTHMLTEANGNRDLQSIVNGARFCFSDGMPIVYYLKKKHKIVQDRITGIDFMLDAIAQCEKSGLSVFFLGASENVLACLKNRILLQFPKLSVAGMISPPYGNIECYDDDSYIRQINDSNAHLVFVSLGCPKQEKWMAKNYTKIRAPLLGVGAAFEVHAGIKKRAPLWMQRSGLEWFYRLIQEPGRLWKRYLKTNIMFIYLFIQSYFFHSND